MVPSQRRGAATWTAASPAQPPHALARPENAERGGWVIGEAARLVSRRAGAKQYGAAGRRGRAEEGYGAAYSASLIKGKPHFPSH